MTEPNDRNLSELGPAADNADTIERTRLRVSDDETVRAFVTEAAQLMHDSHCSDIRIFDVRGKSDLTDYLVIASGTSDRQIRAVSEDVEELAQEHKLARFGREEDAPSKWVVLDFIDVIVHLFEPETRAFYDLEMMWGDAPELTWGRERDRRR